MWCPGRDLNSHGVTHTPLKRTCLPSSTTRAESRSSSAGRGRLRRAFLRRRLRRCWIRSWRRLRGTAGSGRCGTAGSGRLRRGRAGCGGRAAARNVGLGSAAPAPRLFLDQAAARARRPGRVQSQGQRRDEERHGQDRRGPAQERRRTAAPEEGLAAARAEGARQSAALPRLQEYGRHEADAYADVKRRDHCDQKTGHPEVPPFLRKGIGRRAAYHWACGSVNRPGSPAARPREGLLRSR